MRSRVGEGRVRKEIGDAIFCIALAAGAALVTARVIFVLATL